MTPLLRHRWLPGLTLVLLALVALGWQIARNPAREERDVAQERLDQASPPLSLEHTMGQTFVAQYGGLKGIELLLVVYDPSRELPPEGRITLTLERVDRPLPVPIVVNTATAGLKHNQPLRFSFAPLVDSRYATYRFTVQCDADYGLGFWYSTSEAYAYGERLEDGAKQAGDVRFSTYYDYRLTDTGRDLVRMLGQQAHILPALLLLLVLPGAVLCLYLLPPARLGSPERLDPPTWLALAVSLSVAVWPILLLWTAVARVSLADGRIWGLVALWLVAGIARAWTRRENARDWLSRRGNYLPYVVLTLVIALTAATRLLQVRDLVVPAWVDSVHHTMITQLISTAGFVPSSLEPYLPIQDFHYHFGFHANAAVLAWLGGLLPYQAVLALGQILNAATPLGAYALAHWLTRRCWAGVIAALVTGTLSFMPAYLVSWGRYTQLAGLLLLPLLCLVTSWLLDIERPRWGLWGIGIILLAGLALVHYRVLVFYILFWLCYPFLMAWREHALRTAVRRLVRAGLLLGGLGAIVILPWVLRFALQIIPDFGALYGGWASENEAYNTFPVGLITAGWTRQLLYVAGAGVIWGLVRRQGRVLVLAAWVGLWLLTANLHLLGLRDIWLIHNESVVISLWLPVSALCGWLVADGVRLLGRGLRQIARRDWHPWLSWGMAAVVLALAWQGSWRMIDIVNPVTVLATPDDMRAIAWIAQNTPRDARFLINTRLWQGQVHAGSDAGWWLPYLAQRAVTLPNVLYTLASPDYRQSVNDLASAVEEARSLENDALRARLAREGVTHIYVGTQGGTLMPKELDSSPYVRLCYASGPVRVYAFVPDP